MSASVHAQSTNIEIGNTVLQPSVKRLGINLGTLTFYDSGQTTQNLLVSNSGFEGQIWNSTIRCLSGTATSCTDDDQWSGWPAGFWNGATFEVFYGAAAGRTGSVSYSTATSPSSGQGITLNFSGSGVAPALGDYLIVRKTVPGGSAGGWDPATSGAGSIGDNFTDLPPGTLGKQTAVLTAPGPSDTASISGFFDSTAGKSFIQLNGTYQLQFKAKALGGSNKVNVVLGRVGQTTYINQAIALTNSWKTYTASFTASENGSAIGTVGLTLSTVGSDSFELDDVSVSQLNGDPTNTTVFRDSVVAALRTLQPGTIRYWGGQLGETLDNLLVPQFGRQRSGYLAWYTESDTIDYGLHDFLALCQTVGAEPWFVVPSTFSTTDANNLIEYLAGSSGSTYGSKRAALGQAVPWTQVFSKIHLEFGNEVWNSTFKGGSIEYSEPDGSRAQTIFGVMRGNPNYVASQFDLVLGGQSAWPGRNTDIQNYCNNNDSMAMAPYTMSTVNSYSDAESLFGSSFAEPEAYMSSTGSAEGLTPGMVYQDAQAIQASKHPVPMSFYEINMGTLNGSISQAALNAYTPSLGGGLTVVDTMLLGMAQYGVINQNMFALPQYDFIRPDGKSVLLWGAVVDMGNTNRKRPQFLAMQLANQALSSGATMLQTVHTGSNPTWDQPLLNTVQLNGAHYIQSYAFKQGNNASLIVFNLSRSSGLQVVFSGVNAPSGYVQMQQLTSAYPTDTNENANIVNIVPSTLSNFDPTAGLALPPYSMTVLNWNSSGTATIPVAPVSPVTTPSPAPVISSVSVTSISATTSTVTWTTDQASSTQLNYGTTTAYGATASGASKLTTSHSVSLSGLQPSTTYDFVAVSANASGASSTSANTTLTTTQSMGIAPPQISGIESWNITTSSITISWSTNEPATTMLSYGVSSSLGMNAPVQTSLSTNHAITLTGLNSGTTYYFVAQSADASGNVGSSSTQTAVTTGVPLPPAGTQVAPPQLSYVLSWGITNTEASITWSTNEPSTTALAYGTTTALGTVTPTQSGLTLTHGVTLTGLNPGTTYYFVAHSADSNGNLGFSSTYSFTTGGSGTPGSSNPLPPTDPTPSGSGPTISYLASWGLTGSGITISWATNAPSTTSVSYGTTSALGQTTPLQTALTSTHGVVLSGLAPSTTYYFLAQSTDANGNSGYSPTYTFTTIANAPPVISNIVVTPYTWNQAQISWTTSVPAASYVQYGPTAAYGRWTTHSSATTTPQLTLDYVPSGVIHYSLVSIDAYGNQVVSPDATFTEP